MDVTCKTETCDNFKMSICTIMKWIIYSSLNSYIDTPLYIALLSVCVNKHRSSHNISMECETKLINAGLNCSFMAQMTDYTTKH